MFDQVTITESYEPPEQLRGLLEDVQHKSVVHTSQNQELRIFDKLPARIIKYDVEYQGYRISGRTILSPFGIFCSLHNDQGMAASQILARAFQYGKPTLLYEDHESLTQTQSDYHNLTAEWYSDNAIERNVPQIRLQVKLENQEAEKRTLDTIEDWAEHWLSLE